MIPERSLLQEKIAALIDWEKVKRRERLLVSALCYAVLAALILLPANRLLAAWMAPEAAPLVFFLIVAPYLFFRGRWRSGESTRAVSRLDRALGLEARALTAWEIIARAEVRPAELLVLRQAGDRLRSVDPRTLFERSFTWHAYWLVPLLVLWFGLLRFDFGGRGGVSPPVSAAKTTAQKLREFSRELQEKAGAEGLGESLEAGRELEKIARRKLGGETGDESFREELGAMARKMETLARTARTASELLAGADSRAGLEALRAEIEALRDSLNFPDASAPGGGLERKLAEQLGALPRLKREIEQGLPAPDQNSEQALRAFLDRLEKDVAGEQDRRTLLEAQEFLESLLRQGEGRPGDGGIRVARPGEPDAPSPAEKEKGGDSLPGDEPGRNEGARRPPPPSGAGAATHLKGLLGEGKSGGATFRGKPAAGESQVSREEVVVSYRRRAEAELNSERIPERLKEPIRRYFLSLGMGQEEK